MEDKWVEKISNNLDDQVKDLYKRDIKYFQLDRFKRMAKRLDENKDSCHECKNLKLEMEDISINLASYVNSIPTGRRKLEKKDDLITKHLKKQHHIHPVYYFVSLYSFIGMIIGGVLGFIIYTIIPDIRIIYSIAIPWIVGLIAGYFVGNKKDWKVRREKRIL